MSRYRLEREAGRIRIPGFAPALSDAQESRARELRALLAEAGLEAPAVTALAATEADLPETQALLEHLVRTGVAVRLSATLVLDRNAVDGFIQKVRDQLGGKTGLGPADFRPVANLSRRLLVPLLQHLDVLGVTVRMGDLRDVVG